MWIVGAGPAADADALRGAGLRGRPRAAGRGGAVRRRGQRRAPLAALGVARFQPSEMMKIAHAADARLVLPPQRGDAAAARLRRRRAAARGAGAADRAPARPRHRAARRRGRLLRDLPRRPVAGRCSPALGVLGAGRACRSLWGMLHDYQRRRILTLLDPTHGSARRGLPHHPVDHRGGLGRHHRQGLAATARRRTWSSSPSAPPTSSSPCSPRSSACSATSCCSRSTRCSSRAA